MSVLLLALVLAALFGTSLWSGQTLARHHSDGLEMAAVAALGAAVLGGLWVVKSAGGLDGMPMLGLVGAGAGGLFTGYVRAEPVE